MGLRSGGLLHPLLHTLGAAVDALRHQSHSRNAEAGEALEDRGLTRTSTLALVSVAGTGF